MLKFWILFIALQYIINNSFAQGPLKKVISVSVNRQKLSNVLEIMSNTGNFYFSYNSSILKKDSIVTVNFVNKPVKEILLYLFREQYEFIESGNYIILRKKPIDIPIFNSTKQNSVPDKVYYLTGYVIDEFTGEKLSRVSVFEPNQLSSNLSDENGFFKLKLKSKYNKVTVRVNKDQYRDTTILLQHKVNQKLFIPIRPQVITLVTIKPEDIFEPDVIQLETPKGKVLTYLRTDLSKAKISRVERFFISNKLKLQGINLKNYFTTRNFQMSVVPGIGTQGLLSSQISNNYSLNIFGGYTGGVKVVEIGGLFNINKQNVRYAQFAGVFNTVGGTFMGVQMAGVQNLVLDSVKALQAAGVSNFVKDKFKGMQIAGIYNHVADTLKGVQIAGVANFAKATIKGWQVAGVGNWSNKAITGVQIAGVVNLAHKEIKGVQIAGVINYAKKLKGLQVGVFNVADTSDGYSIGLINIIRNGYHKISFSTNEVANFNIGIKTGNRKLYSIVQAGVNRNNNNRLYSFGYGFGKDIYLSKKMIFNTELGAQYLYLGTWDYLNLQNKISFHLQWQPFKNFSIYAGPSFSVLVSDQQAAVPGYAFPITNNAIKKFDFSNRTKGWIGFTAGVNLF